MLASRQVAPEAQTQSMSSTASASAAPTLSASAVHPPSRLRSAHPPSADRGLLAYLDVLAQEWAPRHTLSTSCAPSHASMSGYATPAGAISAGSPAVCPSSAAFAFVPPPARAVATVDS
jgi:hypothetical protein